MLNVLGLLQSAIFLLAPDWSENWKPSLGHKSNLSFVDERNWLVPIGNFYCYWQPHCPQNSVVLVQLDVCHLFTKTFRAQVAEITSKFNKRGQWHKVLTHSTTYLKVHRIKDINIISCYKPWHYSHSKRYWDTQKSLPHFNWKKGWEHKIIFELIF